MSAPLGERVAVVTGASRGIGKGIALELGAAGATVYVTGRTRPGAEELPRWATSVDEAGTIDQTAAEVSALGGHGIAVACDHDEDEQVHELFERVGRECGRLDVLVNNVCWNDLASMLGKRFWELPLDSYDRTTRVGLRSHYVASALAAPLMLETGSALIVNVSSEGAAPGRYIMSVPYGVAKAGVDKLTDAMHHDIHELGVAVVSIWPGLVATEQLVVQAETGDDGRPRLFGLDLSQAESPRLSGRAVVALATDPEVAKRSGRSFRTTELARDYGFTDADGRVPDSDVASAGEDAPDFWRRVRGRS